MKFGKTFLILVALLSTSIANSIFAAPQITQSAKYYNVSGETPAQIRKSLTQDSINIISGVKTMA